MPASVLSSAPRFPCAPNPQYVEQLGDYLTQSVRQGKLRMGVLTNGNHWVLGKPGAGEVRMTRPTKLDKIENLRVEVRSGPVAEAEAGVSGFLETAGLFGFADPEHLCGADWTDTPSCRTPILHRNGL